MKVYFSIFFTLFLSGLNGQDLLFTITDSQNREDVCPESTRNPWLTNITDFTIIETSRLSEQITLANTSFQLPDRSEVITAEIHRISIKEDKIIWRGKVDCTDGTVLFIMQDGILDGYIQIGDTSYEIRSICEDFAYLYIADTPDEENGLCADHDLESETQPGENLSSFHDGNNQCCISTVLFLYTASSNEYGDPFVASEIGLDDINTALQNSAICHKVEQVGFLPFNFIETGDIQADRNALVDNADIQALREQFAADIVILIAGDVYGEFGISTFGNFGDPDFSHAIVEVNAPSGRHTLAHEWAHDYSADHINGLRFGDNNEYNTMMNPLPLNHSRILHFSNPTVDFDGFATGIEITDDNAGKLNNWGCYVSNYTYSGNPCESVYSNITTETLITEEGLLVSRYCLEISNCYNRPDNIAWEYSLNGTNWTALTEDTECVDVFIGIIPQLALFRVEFECGECEVESEIFVFNKKCKNSETRNIEEENLLDVFPNPATNILQINYSEGYSNGSIIQIIDINGRIVYEENLNRSINIETLQSGTYMLKITNKDKIAYAKFVKI